MCICPYLVFSIIEYFTLHLSWMCKEDWIRHSWHFLLFLVWLWAQMLHILYVLISFPYLYTSWSINLYNTSSHYFYILLKCPTNVIVCVVLYFPLYMVYKIYSNSTRFNYSYWVVCLLIYSMRTKNTHLKKNICVLEFLLWNKL